MSTRRPLRLKAFYWELCLASSLIFCGCHPRHQSVSYHFSLTSPRVSLAALKRGDLAAAARILEPRLAATPKDAELSYALGSVYLIQSDSIKDPEARRSLQAHGWQLVEAASGRHYNADSLLAHAYLVGRWGKKRNSDLYARHVRLSSEVYKKTPHTVREEVSKAWYGVMP